MTFSKLNSDGVMLFEQPFARVPYENYRKVFRTSQKNIEKEMGAVQTAANELAKRPDADADATLKAIDGMIARVDGLKRKLSDMQETSGSPTLGVMRERFQHLAAVENVESLTAPEFTRWADVRLDRWLVDWCLRNGKEKTARMIATQKGIEKLVDIDLFSDIRRIEDGLTRRSCTEALTWCSENKQALRKLKNTLEFDLRLQEYIELARVGKAQEAMAYSKKHLLSWQETHHDQIIQVATLLAVPPARAFGPYKRLYDLGRWNTLIQSFRLAIYHLSTLPTEPLLHLAMYAGLASLKLPACYGHETRNVDCPVCQPDLGTLAREAPFSHHVNSTIVCRISGKIMGADNMPLAFRNGQVYSREALEEMAARNDGYVVDPRDPGERQKFSELRKVFIS
ncbi:CTLH/CRA C-terminal to lish motif domain-containing protein [Epithele typhae]|uniref:CTLH/CRA C-terminal to lish motif domain-containing protein n=1 Tax=Epithele typhae TaxID=378194 RepID=UPI00200896D0|nr:CTLH/CRA C-terminal to lish motif domain-containing protein [Epithele typhae]KAH9941578.1 CTLH/CRA C-terminal to lish motif domain-containing protein [Epithele typhae]